MFQVLVATYSRGVLKQTGTGHFSPIAGYHPGSDRVLILDTARFKYPPHWVQLSLLFEAMTKVDSESGAVHNIHVGLHNTYIEQC